LSVCRDGYNPAGVQADTELLAGRARYVAFLMPMIGTGIAIRLLVPAVNDLFVVVLAVLGGVVFNASAEMAGELRARRAPVVQPLRPDSRRPRSRHS
jgi:hypothetical protein